MWRQALFPTQASSVAAQVDTLFFFLIGLTLVFSLGIAATIVVFMVRYRRRHDDEYGVPVHGSLALEALWSGVPFALSMVVFFWGASLFATLRRPPDDAIEIHVVGKQWMWKLQHMEGRREINELHVPVGRPVKLVLTSEDVIHSFFVPAFRTKQDAVPGRYTTTWFEPTRVGQYHLFCAEYCGTIHSGMIGKVVVMEPAAFQAWLAGAEGVVPVAASGEQVFAQQGCVTCHRAGAGARGPVLANLFGTAVQLASGGTVVADETYLRESIVNPQAKVVRGFQPIMPTYQGLIGEEDLMRLVAYLKSLKEQPQ